MDLKKIIQQVKPPCAKCPYKLGLVQTFVNPCPQCRENGYQIYERFQSEMIGGDRKS